MATQAVNESRFISTLRQSQLLSEEEINPFIDKLDSQNDHDIAREFLKAQLLTPFQAKYVLHGRWRGLVIGDYRIIEPLSVGGMGEVYLARHKDADESVAIKILRTELREVPKNIERFRLEAFAVMTLKHANLLHGIEYGTIEQTRKETHYLITEFVRGPNLYELTVIRRQLPWQQACDLISQAARGLHVAHKQKFVHRDVKPGNIIISTSGVAKIVDFGLAQYKGPNESFAFSMRKRRGTQRYAAPEQTVMDEPIDARADIYSLGCTLFFALCGRPPSENATNLFPRSRTVIERLQKMREDIPEELVAIIRRMLRRAPDQRYNSAAAVAQALEPFGKRMSVDVNFPALLRARDKARRSQSSLNTDAKIGGTTVPGESRQSEGDESYSFDASDVAADVPAVPQESDSMPTQDASVGRFVAIYRRHRQHVDRLRERVETLEEELQSAQDNESELLTLLNVKSIEQEQLITENRQQQAALSKKSEELQAANAKATEDEHTLNEQEQTLKEHTTRISELQQKLTDAQRDKDSLEQHLLSIQRNQEHEFQLLLSQMQSRIDSAKQLYASERAKRRRTCEIAKHWRTQARSEQESVQRLREYNQELTHENVLEKQQREQIQDRLNEAKQKSEALSFEIATIFNQISTDQLEETFFDSYEQACEQPAGEEDITIEPDSSVDE